MLHITLITYSLAPTAYRRAGHYNAPMRLPGLALLLTALLACAVLTGAAPTQLYFSDDFSGQGEHAFYEGALDQRHFAYVDGEYQIDTSGGTSYGQSILLDSLSSYRIEATGRMASAADQQRAGFGISFNYRQRASGEGGDFLLFMVYDRGAFTVLRYLDGRTSVLFSPTKTQFVRPGEPVALTVEALNGQLTFYLQGAEVAQLREDRLVSGGFGLFCTAGGVARFDDFKVYADKAKPTAVTDDFSSAKTLFEGDWGGASYHYDNGRYVIDTSATEYIGLSPFPTPAANFELAVDVELLSGQPEGGYGVYVRDYKSDNGFNQFRFLLSEDWYAVEQSVEDRPLALAQWAQHQAVKPSGVNRIKLSARDGQLSYSVNGVEVWSGVDDHPHSGAYGLYASGGIKVAFDNLSFTALP
jgi:hypothetical protein